MIQSWIVLLPPLLVLVLAIITRNVLYALGGGIILAAVIATHGAPVESISLITNSFLEETRISDLLVQSGNYDHAYTFGFLILLGVLIQLITRTGGMLSFARSIKKYLKNARDAQTTSLLLSLAFFIDDYLSSITIGSIMQPITDSFKIPRVKLAFLMDSISAPLCMLVPISSWVAFLSMVMQSSGISIIPANNPIILNVFIVVYLKVIPYTLYPIFIIFSAWFIVRKELSFGAMAYYEDQAKQTGKVCSGIYEPTESIVTETDPSPNKLQSLSNFLIPMALFLTSIPLIALYAGSDSQKPWYAAFKSADTILYSLFFSSLLACSFSIVFFMIKKQISYRQLPQIFITGFNLFRNPILTLTLAWMLSNLLKNNLDTGTYLATLFISSAPLYILPLIFFITAFIITLCTGSSWGTFSIMLPVGIPLVGSVALITAPTTVAHVPILLPVLGALFSGGIAGSHFSPLADSSIMAASSAKCDLIDHVKTQINYSIPAVISTLFCFGLLGILKAPSYWLVCIIIIAGLCSTALMLLLRSWMYKGHTTKK